MNNVSISKVPVERISNVKTLGLSDIENFRNSEYTGNSAQKSEPWGALSGQAASRSFMKKKVLGLST